MNLAPALLAQAIIAEQRRGLRRFGKVVRYVARRTLPPPRSPEEAALRRDIEMMHFVGDPEPMPLQFTGIPGIFLRYD